MVSSLVLDSNQRKTVLQTVLLTSLATRHLVRVKGLEPPRLSASDPKSDVSTISPHPHHWRSLKFSIGNCYCCYLGQLQSTL